MIIWSRKLFTESETIRFVHLFSGLTNWFLTYLVTFKPSHDECTINAQRSHCLEPSKESTDTYKDKGPKFNPLDTTRETPKLPDQKPLFSIYYFYLSFIKLLAHPYLPN